MIIRRTKVLRENNFANDSRSQRHDTFEGSAQPASLAFHTLDLTDDVKFYLELQAERIDQLQRLSQERANPKSEYVDVQITEWIATWLSEQEGDISETMTMLCESWLPALTFARGGLPFQGDSNIQGFIPVSELNAREVSLKEFEAPFILIYHITMNVFMSIVEACKRLNPDFSNILIRDFMSNSVQTVQDIVTLEKQNFERACRHADFDPESSEDVSYAMSIADDFMLSEFQRGYSLSDSFASRANRAIYNIIMFLVRRTVDSETNFLSRHFWALSKYAQMFINADIPSIAQLVINPTRLEFKAFLNFGVRNTRMFRDEKRTLGTAILGALDFIRKWSCAIGGVWLEEDIDTIFRSRGRAIEILLQEVSDRSLLAEEEATKAIESCHTLFVEIRPLADSIHPFIPFDLIYMERLARRGDTVSQIAFAMNCSERLVRQLLESLRLTIDDEGRIPKSEQRHYARKSDIDVETIRNVYIKTKGDMRAIKKAFKRSISIQDFTDFRRLFGIEDVEKSDPLEPFKNLRWGSSIVDRDTIACDYMKSAAHEIIEKINKGYYGQLPKGKTVYYKLFKLLMEKYCPAINLSLVSRSRPKYDHRYRQYYR